MLLPLKWGSLSYYNTKSRHTWKKKHAICIGLLTDEMDTLKKKFIITFCWFWSCLYCLKIMFLFKAQNFTSYENYGIIFSALYFFFISSKTVSQTLKVLYQNGDVNVPYSVIFLYVFKKSGFSNENKQTKHPWRNLRYSFIQKLLKFDVTRYIKRKFYYWYNLELFKVIRIEQRDCFC